MERAANVVATGLNWLGKVWAAHRSLLRSNRAYETAMASAAAQVIIQTSWERLVAALVTGLLDIYAVLRRAATWSSRFSSAEDWALDANFEDGWSTTWAPQSRACARSEHSRTGRRPSLK